ncbi:MAG: class I SAM-dependent methyltransferase [Thermodesulfobacteriota bacterium]
MLYIKPHFRLEKIARLINIMSCGNTCTLLDIGCGPATLRDLLNDNVTYFGIDIALHQNHPNLIEMDFIENEIRFLNRKFDFVVAAGVFEYVGNLERTKLSEIRELLKEDGNFILTYSNIQHIKKPTYPTWNNIKTISAFKSSVESVFKIERFFPSYHGFGYPMYVTNFLNKRFQMGISISIPLISRLFGVNYIFICSLRKNGKRSHNE